MCSSDYFMKKYLNFDFKMFRKPFDENTKLFTVPIVNTLIRFDVLNNEQLSVIIESVNPNLEKYFDEQIIPLEFFDYQEKIFAVMDELCGDSFYYLVH